MSNCENGKIYKITSKNTDMFYIGSTTRKYLKTRLNEHRHASKNDKGKMCSHLMFIWGDAEIELIENYPCENKLQLRIREQYYIDLFPDYVINTRKAQSDKNESTRIYMRKRRADGLVEKRDKSYHKEWYQKNRERELEKSKQYREDFRAEKAESDRKYRQTDRAKERKRENAKIRVFCDVCQKFVSKGNFHTHKKTKNHLENLNK